MHSRQIHHEWLAANFACHTVKRITITVDEQELRLLTPGRCVSGQPKRHGAADTARRSGDDRPHWSEHNDLRLYQTVG